MTPPADAWIDAHHLVLAIIHPGSPGSPASSEAASSGNDHTSAHNTPEAAAPADHQMDCSAPAAPIEQSAADALVARTTAAVVKCRDLNAALADGYTPITPPAAQMSHGHTNLCIAPGRGMVGVVKDGCCPAGSVNEATTQMMHVHMIDRPGGPLSHDATPADIKAGVVKKGLTADG